MPKLEGLYFLKFFYQLFFDVHLCRFQNETINPIGVVEFKFAVMAVNAFAKLVTVQIKAIAITVFFLALRIFAIT